VVSADGTSMANFLAMAALISPGDEVLIEHPTYEPILGVASFLGAKINRFQRKASEAFRLDPAIVKAALSDRTKLIVLTNLHNPSGTLAEEAELRAIGKLGARVLIDEVYLDASGQRSAVHLGPEFVVTNSLTKVYLFGVNQAHQAERLGCIAFDHIDQVIGDEPAMLASNRQLFNHFLATRDDLECAPAVHGITAFPWWNGGDTQRLDDHLRANYDCAVVPGRWFELPDHFRVGFGIPADVFSEALTRLGRGLDDLQ
jgi:aspartate/methionine/tyrosine aminotransferase